jgi:acyl-CoA oxidase
VAKELLDRLDELSQSLEISEFDSNLSVDYLSKLLNVKFVTSLNVLSAQLKEKVAKSKGNLFDPWMGQLSDEIQLTSRSYGEVISLKIILATKSPQLEIIQDTARLYALTILKDNLAWLILHDVLSKEQSLMVLEGWNKAVRGFGRSADTWVEAFMIPDQLIHAPIARNWVKYNQYDNLGEVLPHSKY